MYKLTRSDEPDCLKKHAATWTRKFLTPPQKTDWPANRECYKKMREQLANMSKRHCVYCDGLYKTSPITIEHFHPKGNPQYAHLVYQWANLFACCTLCQGKKKERFDPMLLKPDEQDYTFNRYFCTIYQTGEIKINPFAQQEDQKRAKATLDFFAFLNDDEHKRWRLAQMEYFTLKGKPFDSIDDYEYRFFLQDA